MPSDDDDITRWLRCDDCGRVGPDVSESACPFAEDVWGTEQVVALCPSCYRDRGEEI